MSNEEMDRLAPPAQMIDKSGSLEIIPENCSLDPSGRLSISLDDKNVSSPSSCGSPIQSCRHTQSLSRPPANSRGHHEVKSYSCLPQWDINRRHSFTTRRVSSMALTSNLASKVHQRQTERMRHRSEWFLSDPTGMVTVKCRPSSVMMTPTNHRTSPVPSGPPSLPCSRPPPLPSSQPPRPSPNCSMGRLSPNVCDNMSISPMATMSTLPKSSLPMASKGPYHSSPTSAQSDVRLRRRLSDKDKERRLVRRSSSKKKDKENGGKSIAPGEVSTACSSTVAGVVVTNSGPAGGPTTTDQAVSSSGGVIRGGPLKRTGSADATSNNNNNHHPLLFRTGSEDSPASAEVKEGLTRSLPRI